jgi:hypothetical protein
MFLNGAGISNIAVQRTDDDHTFGCSLGLGLSTDVGWPRFDYLVGLLPFFCLLRFPDLAPFWYEFLVLSVDSYRVTILPIQVEFDQ